MANLEVTSNDLLIGRHVLTALWSSLKPDAVSSHAPLVEKGVKLWLTRVRFREMEEQPARNQYAKG